jgi:hypothetical protein
MNKAQKIALSVTACVIVGVVIWLALRAKQAAAAPVDGGQEPAPDNTGSVSTATPVLTFPIREGARGEAVMELQQAANRYLSAHPVITQAHPDVVTLVVDGIWGVKTTTALYYTFNVGEMGVLSQVHYDAIMSQSYS